MEGTIRQATRFFANRKSARTKYAYTSSSKDKDLVKCIICDEKKRKKERPLPLTNISLTQKVPEYSELHIKNNNAKYIDGANWILLTLVARSLLAADVAFHKWCS